MELFVLQTDHPTSSFTYSHDSTGSLPDLDSIIGPTTGVYSIVLYQLSYIAILQVLLKIISVQMLGITFSMLVAQYTINYISTSDRNIMFVSVPVCSSRALSVCYLSTCYTSFGLLRIALLYLGFRFVLMVACTYSCRIQILRRKQHCTAIANNNSDSVTHACAAKPILYLWMHDTT